ncbi:MAG: hypothetical protein FWE05_06775 [Defluviitaleaceae bacterium]|nr:hypothetical protein [Defluviitaleaceae bacterium]
MKKLLLLVSIVTILVIAMSSVVFASDENDKYTEYIPVQVIFEVIDFESGEFVSREFFDVYLPEIYASTEFVGIAPRTTLSQREFTFFSNQDRITTGIIETPLALGHTRHLLHHSGTLGNTTLRVAPITIHTQTELGVGFLLPGQALRIHVPFNTMSYQVFMDRQAQFVGRMDRVIISIF